jgi:hypothetical protein
LADILKSVMRHPLLRILVALLIGVVTPLCCCQAALLVGSACDGQHLVAAEIDSCCGGCSTETASRPASDRPQDDPNEDQPPSPGECPSCPSCQGTTGGTGAKAESRLPAFEQQWDALATFALAVLWTFPTPDAKVLPISPGWALDPPHLKANREALRWHCALVV